METNGNGAIFVNGINIKDFLSKAPTADTNELEELRAKNADLEAKVELLRVSILELSNRLVMSTGHSSIFCLDLGLKRTEGGLSFGEFIEERGSEPLYKRVFGDSLRI